MSTEAIGIIAISTILSPKQKMRLVFDKADKLLLKMKWNRTKWKSFCWHHGRLVSLLDRVKSNVPLAEKLLITFCGRAFWLQLSMLYNYGVIRQQNTVYYGKLQVSETTNIAKRKNTEPFVCLYLQWLISVISEITKMGAFVSSHVTTLCFTIQKAKHHRWTGACMGTLPDRTVAPWLLS